MKLTAAAKAKLAADLKRRRNGGRGAFGTLRQTASGRLQARYVGPDEQRYTAPMTFDNLADADGWLATVRREIMLGTWTSPGVTLSDPPMVEVAEVTLNQLFASYMDEGDLKPRTRDLYSSQWQRLVAQTLGDQAVTSVTPTMVAQWRASLPPAPRQREQVGDLVRAVLNLAIERQLVLSNPAATSRRKTRDKRGAQRDPKRTFRLTRDQVATAADAMPEHRRFAVLFAAGTGVRFGEMAALRRSDLVIEVDDAGVMTRARVRIERAVTRARGEDGRMVTIEGMPKTAAGVRTLAVPSRLHSELERHLSAYAAPGANGLIFPGISGGHLTSSELYGEKPGVRKNGKGRKARLSRGRGWFRARVEAGVPNARWHLLRHTAISEAVDAGARPADLLARFGHTDLATSAIYQHSAAEADDNLADRL